jgi:hypothetical protein
MINDCINNEIVHNKIASCNKVTNLKHLGKFLYQLKCKWEIESRKWCMDLGKMREDEL